jgi:predicted nucleic acid-binding protein
MLSPLLVVEESDLRNGLRLFQEHIELGSFDAVLAAAAQSIEATAVVSADTAFSAVGGLRHVTPDAAGVESLLRSTADDRSEEPQTD